MEGEGRCHIEEVMWLGEGGMEGEGRCHIEEVRWLGEVVG